MPPQSPADTGLPATSQPVTPAPALLVARPQHGAPGTIAPASQVSVPILMYHHVRELPANATSLERDLTVSPAHFEQQLTYLEKAGCNAVTLADIHAFFAEKKPLPARPVCITFDDGYLDNYTVAFKALQRHGMPGTFFITTAVAGDGQHMTWAELREMKAAGMEIGSHTVHHLELPGLPAAKMQAELANSRKRLNAEVGGADFFCYPSGRNTPQAAAQVKAAGYKGAVTTKPGATVKTGEQYTMPRVRVHGGWDGKALAFALAQTAGNDYKPQTKAR